MASIHGREIGEMMVDLGAGRKKYDDPVDPMAGLLLQAHLGDEVQAGEPLAWLYGEKAEAMAEGLAERLNQAYQVRDSATESPSMILREL